MRRGTGSPPGTGPWSGTVSSSSPWLALRRWGTGSSHCTGAVGYRLLILFLVDVEAVRQGFPTLYLLVIGHGAFALFLVAGWVRGPHSVLFLVGYSVPASSWSASRSRRPSWVQRPQPLLGRHRGGRIWGPYLYWSVVGYRLIIIFPVSVEEEGHGTPTCTG